MLECSFKNTGKIAKSSFVTAIFVQQRTIFDPTVILVVFYARSSTSTYFKRGTMIRILITTTSSWSPTAHGSSHAGPEYAQRQQRARVTSELGTRLTETMPLHAALLEIPSDTSPQNILVRYSEASPHDVHSPDIEVVITVPNMSITDDLAKRYAAWVSEVFDSLLDCLAPYLAHQPSAEPRVITCTTTVPSFSFIRSRYGLNKMI